MKIQIAPSILSADFGRLNEEVASIESAADLIHIDVMDGHFVPNLTFGAPVMKCIDSKLPKDVHLMIDNPEKYIEEFVNAGAHRIYVHFEACMDLRGVLMQIIEMGVLAGVVIKPMTAVSEIFDVMDLVDSVMVMTVEPGFGGQSFMSDMLGKIEELRGRYPDVNIAVDGGINDQTAKLVIDAGANILIAGSYVFKSENRKNAIESLRG